MHSPDSIQGRVDSPATLKNRLIPPLSFTQQETPKMMDYSTRLTGQRKRSVEKGKVSRWAAARPLCVADRRKHFPTINDPLDTNLVNRTE